MFPYIHELYPMWVNYLEIKWFETLCVSSLSEDAGVARSANALCSPDHGRSEIFRTIPRLVSDLPLYPSNSVGRNVCRPNRWCDTMKYSEETLHECLKDGLEGLQRKERLWQDGGVPIDGITNITRATAKEYERVATCAALLNATQQSWLWFGKAAQFYFEQICAGRLRRDIRGRIVWEGEPRKFYHALNTAVLSRQEELITEIATAAIEIDESYLEEFAADYPDSPPQYYDMKVHAALTLGDDQVTVYLDELRAAIDEHADVSQYWKTIPQYYQAIVDDSAPAAEAAIADLYSFFADQEPDPEDPRESVLHDVCAYIVLARHRGVDVDVPLESDRLPAALLRDDAPEDDVELDVEPGEIRVNSTVGLFELEYDDDGTPVIAGRIYHPGGEPVSADDVPEREAGQVLSDDWIKAALEEANWRDHYDDELVADATAAFENGELIRKLVVAQDRVDQYTFDESMSKLPVDDIELLKGAGRRS